MAQTLRQLRAQLLREGHDQREAPDPLAGLLVAPVLGRMQKHFRPHLLEELHRARPHSQAASAAITSAQPSWVISHAQVNGNPSAKLINPSPAITNRNTAMKRLIHPSRSAWRA